MTDLRASRQGQLWAVSTAPAAVSTGCVPIPEQWLDHGDKLGSIAGALLALGALLVAVATWRAARRPAVAAVVHFGRAADELARVVRRQWQREAVARGLTNPEPLRLRWSATSRVVTADEQPAMAGTIDALAAVFRGMSVRQLVIIGPPGVGKTSIAVLVLLRLLQERAPGEPVPVLLTFTGWDPQLVHFDTWLSGRLAEDYRTNPKWTGMVDRGLILPVLDGLDEVPRERGGVILRALTEAMGRDRPLVVTCRAEEYQNLVHHVGTPLAHALVVEVEPVSPGRAAEYLPAGQVHGGRRWAPVLRHLAEQAEGPLAQAFSTPLMVALARTVYTRPSADPGELLRLPDRDAVEQHLLSHYLPTLYAQRLPGRDGHTPAHYEPERARRWLSFLATRMSAEGTRDLAWWRLSELTRRRFVLMLAPGALAVTAAVDPRALPLMAAITVAMVAVASVVRPVMPGRTLAVQVLAALSVGGLAIAGWQALPPAVGTGVLPPAFSTGVLLPWLASTALMLAALTPARFQPEGPGDVLRADRSMAVYVLGLALSVAATQPYLVVFCLMVVLFMVAVGGVGAPWLHFSVARVWFGARGRLPWRIMRFLDDAHRRGVLRQVGAVYQFRHARLQDHLTSGNG